MAVKSTKLNGGGTIGEVQKKHSWLNLLIEKYKNQKPGKKILISVVSVGSFLLAIALLAYVYGEFVAWVGDKKDNNVAVVCRDNSQLISGVANATAKIDSASLKEYADQIQGFSNYQNDPNCLYAIIQYNLSVGDAFRAKQNYDLLTKYDPSNLSESLVGEGFAYKDLESRISYYQKLSEEYERNTKINTFEKP